MSEITKLYENAGVETNKYKLSCTGCKHIAKVEVINGYPSKWICDKYDEVANCDKAEPDYPPFTAEKQIAIENIIFQCNFGICELQRTMSAEFKDYKFVKHYFSWLYHAGDIGYYNEITEEPYGDWDVEYSNPDRKEALAGFVNALWDEYLTSEEKQQIKEILQ